MTDDTTLSLYGLVDLLSEQYDGRALRCSDDFFASMNNLNKSGRAIFDATRFTERGKWMDGWESRRKRQDGPDYCILRLGLPGRIHLFDIDTQHFRGNHPPYATVEGAFSENDEDENLQWQPLLSQVPLRPNAQNLFVAEHQPEVTHVRLRIYPDGGVARFRCFGKVAPRWGKPIVDEMTQPHHNEGEEDLLALANGGLALACSDAFFSPMNNLISPGRAPNMGQGWETRRKRTEGHDWVLLRLAEEGTISFVEVDTNHFKGNYPSHVELVGFHAPHATITELLALEPSCTLLERQPLQAHHRHFFRTHESGASLTHIRMNIFPDGGISRLRGWGVRKTPST